MLINSVGGGGGDEKKPIFCDGGSSVYGETNLLMIDGGWSGSSWKYEPVVGTVNDYHMLLNGAYRKEHLYYFGTLGPTYIYVAGVDLLQTPVTLTFTYSGKRVKEKFWIEGTTIGGVKYNYTLKGEILESEFPSGTQHSGVGGYGLLMADLDASFEVDY